MSSIFINGAQYRVSKALAVAVPVSEIANGKDPIAKTATPPTLKDIVVLRSGWPGLDETVWRALAPTVDSFKLEEADTTDTRLYPAGKGEGGYQTVSDWFSLDQLQDVQITGGEQQYYQYQYVEDPNSRQLQKPTFKSPVVLTFTMDYDQSKPWYSELIAADRLKKLVVVEAALPDGSKTYYYGYPSFNSNPTGGKNENLRNTFVLSLRNTPVTYEA